MRDEAPPSYSSTAKASSGSPAGSSASAATPGSSSRKKPTGAPRSHRSPARRARRVKLARDRGRGQSPVWSAHEARRSQPNCRARRAGTRTRERNLAIGRFSDPIAETLLADHERAAARRACARRPRAASARAHRRASARRPSRVDRDRDAALGRGGHGRANRRDRRSDRRGGQSAARHPRRRPRRARVAHAVAREVDVFEVDHPDSQRDKAARIGAREPVARTLHKVPVDFTRDSARRGARCRGPCDRAADDVDLGGGRSVPDPTQVEATLRVAFADPRRRADRDPYQAPDVVYDATHRRGPAPRPARLRQPVRERASAIGVDRGADGGAARSPRLAVRRDETSGPSPSESASRCTPSARPARVAS